MKKRFVPVLLLNLIIMAALAVCASAQEPSKKVEKLAYEYFKEFPSDKNVVTPPQLFSMMKAGESMLILDIRRPEDYNKNHLKGAVNLSFFDMSIPDALDRLPDDKPIMVYCYTGQTASQVTVFLNLAGKMAKNIQSGFNNGIAKAEGYEAMLEQKANPLPKGPFAVDAEVKAAIAAYFKDKMAQDGTPFVNFNLTPKAVKAIVDEGNDDYLVVSVRRPEDFAKGHVPSAVNIPYGQGMEAALAKLPKNKKIVVYCYTGQTSSQTTAVLRMMGYEAFSMSGGMNNGWLKDGLPVTDK